MRHGANAIATFRVGGSAVSKIARGASVVWQAGAYAQSLASTLAIPRSPYPPVQATPQKRDDMGVVVAFFSPAGYELPRKHFRDTLAYLAACQVPVAVVQVVRPGQKPEDVPGQMMSHVLESEDTMFFKEACWNIGASLLPYSKLMFLDADITFSTPDWYDSASAALDEYDIIQPYDWCQWEEEDGEIAHGKFPSAVPLSQGLAPRLDRYHPGFAWAMRRSAFDALHGFYDRDVVGGGDVAISYSLHPCDTWVLEQTNRDSGFAVIGKSPSYEAYRRNALSLGLKVGYVENQTVNHRWHGARKDRQYESRGQFLPPRIDGELPLVRRDDGLWAWQDASASVGLASYFASRQEDGQ